jgi:isopentenyl phosphate kinase
VHIGAGDPMILVKLGGSVITDKARLRTFRKETCQRLARELSPVADGLILVHGAGSFGHIVAKEHRLHEGFKSESQLAHVAGVQRDVRELDLMVIGALIDGGIRAVSVPPMASALFASGKVKSFKADPFRSMVDLGLTPVTFGDVVPDESMGFSICSGDLMMYELARHFRPSITIFCADVDGVYDSDPKSDPDADLMPRLDRAALDSMRHSEPLTADVTGSIFGKLDRMLDIASHCEKCMILNGNVAGRLGKAVSGDEVVCTEVLPG